MTLGKNHTSAISPLQHYAYECQMHLSKEYETALWTSAINQR